MNGLLTSLDQRIRGNVVRGSLTDKSGHLTVRPTWIRQRPDVGGRSRGKDGLAEHTNRLASPNGSSLAIRHEYVAINRSVTAVLAVLERELREVYLNRERSCRLIIAAQTKSAEATVKRLH